MFFPCIVSCCLKNTNGGLNLPSVVILIPRPYQADMGKQYLRLIYLAITIKWYPNLVNLSELQIFRIVCSVFLIHGVHRDILNK